MSIPLPLSLLLVFGVILVANGSTITTAKGEKNYGTTLTVRWLFIVAGSALITIWAEMAGLA